MCDTEFDAFIFKFQQLWYGGLDAHLNLECNAGNAWVGIRVNLGPFPGPNCHYSKNVGNSSQIRRRNRRAEKRKYDAENCEDMKNEHETAQVMDVNDEDRHKIKNDDDIPIVGEINNVESNIVTDAKMVNTVMPIDNEIQESSLDVKAVVYSDDDLKTAADSFVENPDSQDEIAKDCTEVETEDKFDAHEEKQISSVVKIRATAVIDQSPYDGLMDSEFRSLLKIFTHKDHLKNNIVDIKYDHHSTSKSEERFKHVVAIKVYVETSRLWETPHHYIWRHMGQDTWDISLGASISFIRIHQPWTPLLIYLL